jgi:hypothetical protein
VTLAAGVELRLIGRSSSWFPRLPIEVDSRRQARRGSEQLRLVTWLRGRGCGSIGVYLGAEVTLSSGERARDQWLEVVGHVRPRLVHALPDDPRSAHSPDVTLLFLEVTKLSPTEHRRQRERPRLTSPQQARLLPAYRIGPGFVAGLTQWPDIIYWQLGERPPATGAAWNTVRGVVTAVDDTRYLRYVLSLNREELNEVPRG